MYWKFWNRNPNATVQRKLYNVYPVMNDCTTLKKKILAASVKSLA